MNTEETNIVRKIMLAFAAVGNIRLFRNNVGTAWIGKSVSITKRQQVWLNPGDVVIQQARIFHGGLCVGSSDTIGFRTVEVTPEMIGRKLAVFMAVELKTKSGRATTEQIAFIKMVNDRGGIAFIATDEIEAVQFLNSKNNE